MLTINRRQSGNQLPSQTKLNKKALKIDTGRASRASDISRDDLLYLHVSTERLARAFHRQFLQDLPEHANFTRQDQIYSPKTLERRSNIYGIDSQNIEKSQRDTSFLTK